ncbi:hypothetical protein EON81_20360 [bacterium]|nr:MAG: hypothetical protein EON81_20360 [bacterium]
MILPLALVALPPAPRESSVVVRAEGFEVSLIAPSGWTAESDPNAYDSLPAVLFRKGEDFRTAKNVMFLNLDARKRPDLTAFVANRRASFLKDRPGATVRPASKMETGDGSSALLFDFEDPKIGQYERRAYIETTSGIATLFLQCATPEARKIHVPAFQTLVKGFRDRHASPSGRS